MQTISSLKGDVVNIEKLTDIDIARMFEIYSKYFNNVCVERFKQDLYEKNCVILLKNSDLNQIQGFSTQKLFEISVEGIPVKSIFSGDTIIEKDYWGQTVLAKVWLNFVFSLKKTYKDIKFYWFLICMGYKTYRFLPIYFKKYYPSYNEKTPDFEKKVLDLLGNNKFPLEYNSDTGIITHPVPREYLKTGVADVTENRLKDKHIAFFIKKNPGFNLGNELACLAEISESNLNSIAKRVIKM